MIATLLSAGVRVMKELLAWMVRPPARTRRERFISDVVAELVMSHSLGVHQAWQLARMFDEVIDGELAEGHVARTAEALMICAAQEHDAEEGPCLLPFTSRPHLTSARSHWSATSTTNPPPS